MRAAERERASNMHWRSAKGSNFKSLIPRFKDDDTFVPGPGMYKHNLEKGKSTSFMNSAGRKFTLSTHNVQPWVPVRSPSPSPLEYDGTVGYEYLRKHTPTASLPKVNRWSPNRYETDNVGPGYYTVPPTPAMHSTAFSFSKLPRFSRKKNSKARKVKAKRFPKCRKPRIRCGGGCPSTPGNEKSKIALQLHPHRLVAQEMSSFKTTKARNPYARMEHVFLNTSFHRSKARDSQNAKEAWSTHRSIPPSSLGHV